MAALEGLEGVAGPLTLLEAAEGLGDGFTRREVRDAFQDLLEGGELHAGWDRKVRKGAVF